MTQSQSTNRQMLPEEHAYSLARTSLNSTQNIRADDGKGEPIGLNLSRIGIGDGLWVDEEGVSYVQRNGGSLSPSYLIVPVFESIPQSSFDKTIDAMVQYGIRKNEDEEIEIIVLSDSNEPETAAVLKTNGFEIADPKYSLITTEEGKIENVLRKTNACQFGKRTRMLVGEDGVLYLLPQNTGELIGKPKLSSKGICAGFNTSLEQRAYKTARTGYDTKMLKVARQQMAESNLSDEQKQKFNAKLDEIVTQITQP